MAEQFFDPSKHGLQQWEHELEKQRRQNEEEAERKRIIRQIEHDKAVEERKKQEQIQDAQREKREKRKLQHELKQGPKKKRDVMTEKPRDLSQIEEERRKTDEFVDKSEQKGPIKVIRKEELPQEPEPPASTTKPISKRVEPENLSEEIKPYKPTQKQERQLKKFKKHLLEQEEKKKIKTDPKRLKQINPILTKLNQKIESLEKKKEKALGKDNKSAAVAIESEIHDIESQMRELKNWANIPGYKLSQELRKLLWKPTAEEKALLENPEYVQQGQARCMTEGHQERPAVMRLSHHGVLGEEAPPLTFCEDCAMQFKMTPIMENDPSQALLKRLSHIANLLDQKGLYREANLADRILIKVYKAKKITP